MPFFFLSRMLPEGQVLFVKVKAFLLSTNVKALSVVFLSSAR